MKGKRYKKNNAKDNKKLNETIRAIVFFIFVSVMIVTGIMMLKWLKENKQSQEVMKDISETINIDENTEGIQKYNIDFENLKQTNSDVVAWLKVNGTNIEYPVVKTTNNNYYMTHSFDKKYNSAGWVFIDYKNKFDGTDRNIVIYAHNRRDGSMFGTLKNILTEEWQNNEQNYIISFITENRKQEYQVFSIYKIKAEDYYITTNFDTDNEFEKFITTIKSRSVKDFDVTVSTKDNILTLSTCADNNNYRVVLHAKLVK